MKSFLIAEKAGMTRMFDTAGNAVGATVLKVHPATVLRLKTQEKDGYEAVQIGAGPAREKSVGKTVLGQSGGKAYRLIREFPKPAEGELSQGATIGIEQVSAGDVVDVTATSKGKGFQGVIKRHNFSRGPMTHGSRHQRRPGSIGGTGAARVFPGQKMPGHMGDETVTTRNLVVTGIDEEENAVLVRGSVPGIRGGLVIIRTTGKKASLAAAEAQGAGKKSKGEKKAEAADAAKAKDEKPAEPAAEKKAEPKVKDTSKDKDKS